MNFFECFNTLQAISDGIVFQDIAKYDKYTQHPEQCAFIVHVFKTISRIRPKLRNTLAELILSIIKNGKENKILHFIYQYEVDYIYFTDDAKFYRSCLIKNVVDITFIVSKFIDTRDSLLKKAIPIFAPFLKKEDLPPSRKYVLDRFNGNKQEIKEEALFGAPLNSLQFFIMKDDIETLKNQFLTGGNFNQILKVDDKNMSLLSTAAYFSAVKCFKYLYLNGAEPTQETLYFAVVSGSLEIIHIIQKIDMKAALEASIVFYRPEIFEWLCDYLLEYDYCIQKVTEICKKEEESSSFVAITMIEYSKIDIDKKSLVKNAAFQAIERGFLAKLMILSSLPDFDFDSLNDNGNNMAIAAAGCRSLDILRFILSLGTININYVSSKGMTAVRRAIRKSPDHLAEIVKVSSKELIDDGLKYAAQKCLFESMVMLLENSAEVFIDTFENVPIDSAEFLINNKKFGISKIDEKNKRTALHSFSDKGYGNAVSALLNTGKVDVNAKDSEGNTALHIAVQKSFSDIIRNLLDHGADKMIVNNKNLTPSQMTRNVQIKRLISRYSQE